MKTDLALPSILPETDLIVCKGYPTPGVGEYRTDVTVSEWTIDETLAWNTQYYWQVIAKNEFGLTEGPVWQFTTTPAGDLEHDCDVHFADYCAFAARWADDNCNTANAWCDGADINSDSIVNFKDLHHIALNWLTTQ